MISIVIPVYNEAIIVREAALDLCRALEALGFDYELILSENGSTDRTRAVIAELAAQNPRVRALETDEPNYGRALKRGILEARGSEVICDEIDLCDVAFYQRALPLLAGGADLVVGSKAMKGAKDARPLLRRVGTRVIHRLPRHRHARAQGLPPRAAGRGGARLRGGTRSLRQRIRHPRAAHGPRRARDPHRAAGEAAAVDTSVAPGAAGAQGIGEAGVGDSHSAAVILKLAVHVHGHVHVHVHVHATCTLSWHVHVSRVTCRATEPCTCPWR